MSSKTIQYRFEFANGENPRGRKDEFEEALKQYFEAQALEYGMSALGGAKVTRGYVEDTTGALNEEARNRFINWVSVQPVKCRARIGQIEIDLKELDIMAQVEGDVFEVNNLADSDVKQAARELHELQEKIKTMLAKKQNPS